MDVSVGKAAWVTLIVKEQFAVLPLASVATQLTVLTPTANSEPEAGVQTTPGPLSHESVAEGVVNVTTALLLAEQTLMFAGQAIFGAMVSTTFTVRDAVPIFPLGSVTV